MIGTGKGPMTGKREKKLNGQFRVPPLIEQLSVGGAREHKQQWNRDRTCIWISVVLSMHLYNRFEVLCQL